MHIVTRYGQKIEDIIINSYMDLCVKFKVAERAIALYEVIQNRSKNSASSGVAHKNSKNQEAMDPKQEEKKEETDQRDEIAKKNQNKAIQMGILIKVYG